jgi:hypothetical protein
VNVLGLTYHQRMALAPMPDEKAERELRELGCVCVGFDSPSREKRDALQQKLFTVESR